MGGKFCSWEKRCSWGEEGLETKRKKSVLGKVEIFLRGRGRTPEIWTKKSRKKSLRCTGTYEGRWGVTSTLVIHNRSS